MRSIVVKGLRVEIETESALTPKPGSIRVYVDDELLVALNLKAVSIRKSDGKMHPMATITQVIPKDY